MDGPPEVNYLSSSHTLFIKTFKKSWSACLPVQYLCWRLGSPEMWRRVLAHYSWTVVTLPNVRTCESLRTKRSQIKPSHALLPTEVLSIGTRFLLFHNNTLPEKTSKVCGLITNLTNYKVSVTLLKHGSLTCGPPACVMGPAATYVNYT
jgi:hypothetical protein